MEHYQQHLVHLQGLELNNSPETWIILSSTHAIFQASSSHQVKHHKQPWPEHEQVWSSGPVWDQWTGGYRKVYLPVVDHTASLPGWRTISLHQDIQWKITWPFLMRREVTIIEETCGAAWWLAGPGIRLHSMKLLLMPLSPLLSLPSTWSQLFPSSLAILFFPILPCLSIGRLHFYTHH